MSHHPASAFGQRGHTNFCAALRQERYPALQTSGSNDTDAHDSTKLGPVAAATME